jgi:outer membrane protein assembly factor BamD
MLRTIIISILALLIISCSSTAPKSPLDVYKNKSAQQIFNDGKKALDEKDYETAGRNFEALDALYPFGDYAQKGQLYVIYAYYKDGDKESTIASADRYIRLYPRDPTVDYAYYMKGLANFERNKTWTSHIYQVDPAMRDLSSMREAFVDFNELVTLYPDSRYVPDAQRRMIYIRNLIARHELQVAQYYLGRKAYVAAANRGAYIVKYFENTPAVPGALKVMIAAYTDLGATKQANDAARVLKTSYPNIK